MNNKESYKRGCCPACRNKISLGQMLIMNIFFPIKCNKCNAKIEPDKKIYAMSSALCVCFIFSMMHFYGMPLVKLFDNLIIRLAIFIVEFTLLGWGILYYLNKVVPLKVKSLAK
ncbi:MAG: hypothetical protein MI739_12750 [Bacteroidales bacterium]|nr:hypothetical protein [Bacteroidales bacterium]